MFVAKRNLLVLAVATAVSVAQAAAAEDAPIAADVVASAAAVEASVAPAPSEVTASDTATSADASIVAETPAAVEATVDAAAPEAATPPAAEEMHASADMAPTPTAMPAADASAPETPAADAHAAPAEAHAAPHWAYEGEGGPWNWGGLATDFKTCSEGKRQSPIDISMATVTGLPKIEVNYQPAPLSVKNNGHTAQVDYPEGSFITVDGVKYNLKQFHFHSPSEHSLGGKYYDMVVHLVHKTDDDKLGVIDVMMKKGSESAALKAVFDNMPKEAGMTTQVADAQVNAADLLPKDLTYYNYTGSLTTPPCSEGVNWMVMTNVTEVSDAQVAAFTGVFPKSARPVQPVNGRVVSLGN